MSHPARQPGASWRVICPSDRLREGEEGVRFEWCLDGRPLPAFLVRIDGQPRAWLNRCAHQPVELDWVPGHFFAADRRHLMCSLHGAVYDAVTGVCIEGPCAGRALVPIASRDRSGLIEILEEDSPGGMHLDRTVIPVTVER